MDHSPIFDRILDRFRAEGIDLQAIRSRPKWSLERAKHEIDNIITLAKAKEQAAEAFARKNRRNRK